MDVKLPKEYPQACLLALHVMVSGMYDVLESTPDMSGKDLVAAMAKGEKILKLMTELILEQTT